MDFIKGIEQVKIDPNGINFVGNGNITIDSEKITGDISLNGKVSITNDFDITSKTDFTGDVSLYGKTDFTGDVSINSDVEISGNIEISGNNKFVVTNIGNVGIGTPNPTSKLTIMSADSTNGKTDEFSFLSQYNSAEERSGYIQKIGFYGKEEYDNSSKLAASIECLYGDNSHIPTYPGKSSSNLIFKTGDRNTGDAIEQMRINHDGYVGIGTTQPESTLDVKGKVFISAPGHFGHTRGEMGGVGGHPANGTLSSAIREAQLQINSNVANYLQPDEIPGMKLYIGVFSNNNRSFLQSGNPQEGHDWQGDLLLNPQGGAVTAVHYGVTSDDRIKINEEYITNGLEIVNKLKPQIYDKINIIDVVNNLKNIDISGQTYRESGFIVQDIYYDIPELRHNITFPDGIIPSETREVINDDPTIDPDYSSWGPDPTTLNYIGLMPYLANAIQELSRLNDAKSLEITELKTENKELKEKLQIMEEDMVLVKQKLGL